jgi:hypothetical protein
MAGDTVEVLRGLRAGERIAVGDLDRLADGAVVQERTGGGA